MIAQSMQLLQPISDRWVEEFGRAVEMFTGDKPKLAVQPDAPALSAEQIATLTWWRQLAQGDSSFSIWAGAAETLWTGLSEGPEAQASFFEMLSQANQGTVAVLSGNFPVPLRCLDGQVEAPVLATEFAVAEIKVDFSGTQLGTILLLIEGKGIDLLMPQDSSPQSLTAESTSSDESAEDSPALRESASSISANPKMLARLMDLQLPVSVLLGRTRIPLKEVLKLVSGSVVELDRQVGDYVEILVHGTVVARGEIVSVKGNYGVRIKQVISRQDRLALNEAA